ncbi:MAG: preprotein translocase subunit SecE [Acidimicrobiales bacterium]
MPQHPDPLGVDESTAGFRFDDAGRHTRREGRTTPVQFLRDVQGELRKVAWPSRPTLVNYSSVVLITLVLIVALIFGLNIAFQHLVSYLLTP